VSSLLRLVGVATDTADAAALAGWWAEVLGGTVNPFPEAGQWTSPNLSDREHELPVLPSLRWARVGPPSSRRSTRTTSVGNNRDEITASLAATTSSSNCFHPPLRAGQRRP